MLKQNSQRRSIPEFCLSIAGLTTRKRVLLKRNWLLASVAVCTAECWLSLVMSLPPCCCSVYPWTGGPLCTRSSLHALDAPPPVPLLRPVAGQLRPLRRPPRLVAALLPRARLHLLATELRCRGNRRLMRGLSTRLGHLCCRRPSVHLNCNSIQQWPGDLWLHTSVPSPSPLIVFFLAFVLAASGCFLGDSLLVVREMGRGRRKYGKGKMRQRMNTFLLQQRRKFNSLSNN